MKIGDLVYDSILTVEEYAKMLYDWERHNAEQKQSKSDVNKEGGFIKTLSDDDGNQCLLMRATSIAELPLRMRYEYGDKTVAMFEELIKKDFYFCALWKNKYSIAELIYPDEIWLTKEEALKGMCDYLLKIDEFEVEVY